MSATYHLAFDQFGNPSLTAETVAATPAGQPAYKPGWKIVTTEDLANLKTAFADCERALVLLNGIDETTLEQPPAA